MQLDLGPFLRIVEHPVAHLNGTYSRTHRDHVRPGQSLTHLCRGGNDDPGLRAAVGRVLTGSDKDPIMKKSDRQRSGTHVHTSHAANASHTVDTAGSNTHTPDTTRPGGTVLQWWTMALSIRVRPSPPKSAQVHPSPSEAHPSLPEPGQHPATTHGPRIPGTNAQTSPDGECTPNGV